MLIYEIKEPHIFRRKAHHVTYILYRKGINTRVCTV